MLKREFIIMSTERPDLSDKEIDQRNSLFEQMLLDYGLQYTETIGYFEGKAETSFMVFLDHAKGYDANFFNEIAKKQFNQDCILYRDKYDNCYLGYYMTLLPRKNMYEKISEKFVQTDTISENCTVIDGKYYEVK